MLKITIFIACLLAPHAKAVVTSTKNSTEPPTEPPTEPQQTENSTLSSSPPPNSPIKRDASILPIKNSYGPPNKPFFQPNFNFYAGPPPPPFPGKFNGPKLSYGPPSFNRPNKPVRKFPKPLYGPPPPKPLYGPPKFGKIPKIKFNPGRYGPPEPVPHGPPHPGIPAPPTPPDIKYDGWKPIPGLVSRPADDNRAHQELQIQLNQHIQQQIQQQDIGVDFLPPPVHHYDIPVQEAGTGILPVLPQQLDLPLHDLSVVKSQGFELFPNVDFGLQLPQLQEPSLPVPQVLETNPQVVDTYSSPPLDSYSPSGPYPSNAFPVPPPPEFPVPHLALHQELPLQQQPFQVQHIGLVPPSGQYGVPPNGFYGTPIHHQHHQQHPLNALEINPPKHPVVFREPVPPGLIESIGNSVAQKDAHGVIESSHSANFKNSPTYIPPPIPDPTRPRDALEPPKSFKSVVTSYNAPSGIVDAAAYHQQKHQDSVHAGSEHVSSCAKYHQKPYQVVDQQPAQSQVVEESRNALQDASVAKLYAKDVLSDLGPGAEVVKSVGLDFPEIPLKGKLGTYSIQIQGGGGNGIPVPHDQILSEELLQSILAAIEKPQGPSTEVSVNGGNMALYFRNETVVEVKNAQQYGNGERQSD